MLQAARALEPGEAEAAYSSEEDLVTLTLTLTLALALTLTLTLTLTLLLALTPTPTLTRRAPSVWATASWTP